MTNKITIFWKNFANILIKKMNNMTTPKNYFI